MDQIWNKLKTCLDQLSESSNDFNYDLNSGVTDKKFISVEKTFGKTFPTDFKEFYKVHNGQTENGQGILQGEEFLSIERMLEEANVWKELVETNAFVEDGEPLKSNPETGIKDDWWNLNWIPFTYDGSGNHICIDLDPTSEGTYGQIIRIWHDDPVREILADSFTEWIEAYVSELENDEYVFSDEYGVLINKADL